MIPCAKVADALAEAGHTVTFITIGTIKGKESCQRLFDGTNIKCIMHDIPECEDELIMASEYMDPVDKIMFPLWEPKVIEEYKTLKPDLVVGDWFFRVGITAADELGIPSVLNVGICLESFKDGGLFQLI